MVEIILGLAKAGAVGVILYGLYIWHHAFRELSQLSAATDADSAKHTLMADQLSKFRWMMIFAIAVAALLEGVQHVWPRAHITVSITPFDDSMQEHRPILRKNGAEVDLSEPKLGGIFAEQPKERTTYEVNVLRMRDALRDHARRATESQKIATAQAAQSAALQDRRDIGLDQP
jgi:hypothetical protein